MTRPAAYRFLRYLGLHPDNADALAEELSGMPSRKAHAHVLSAQGFTQAEIGRCLGCSERHIGRLINDFAIP